MIPFLTYFISVVQVPSRKMNMAPLYGGIGIANGGGTSSCRFAEDGDTSYLGRHPTSVFASFVHVARLWQICSHIPLPFPSLFITIMKITTSPQKMKREYCLHSSTVIACAASPFGCPLQVCRSSSRL